MANQFTDAFSYIFKDRRTRKQKIKDRLVQISLILGIIIFLGGIGVLVGKFLL